MVSTTFCEGEITVKKDTYLAKAFRILGIVAVTVLFASAAMAAASLSPRLQAKIAGLANSASAGIAVVSFKTTSGLNTTHLNILRGVGITSGVTYQNLGMVAVELNVGQVRALAANPSVRSIWSNDQLTYHMNAARMLTGVDRLRTDAGFTFRNGGMPVSGSGDFSVFVIDSGIDATHADLPLGTKVIQNTSRVVSSTTGDTGITVGGVSLNGFTPSLSIENVPNNDNVGHGTHCAGIVGGLGIRSGGTYAGVAPGVKIVGSGGGAVIFVINALAGWEYGLATQDLYKIRVITNSYGPGEPEDFDPNNPFVIASKLAHDRNITVLWSGSNDGAEDTINAYGQSPWTITVAAGTKDGMLAGFSSRGVPRDGRLSDNNPNNDYEYPTITAPGTGRAFESSLARFGFTTDIVSVRSITNLTANGGDADTEIPVGMIPFYTQISGTSMATPFTAGVVALMLDADPTLSPDEIKQILIDTATRMPGYEDYEVGAGYINAYAAIDKVYNRSKSFSNPQEVNFNAVLGRNDPAQQSFHIDFSPTVSGPDSANAVPFTVGDNVSRLTVRGTVDIEGEPGLTNLVGIKLYAPDGSVYAPGFPVGTSNLREVTVDDPIPGTWKVEARGTRGISTVPATSPVAVAPPGPLDGTISQVRYTVPFISDIQGIASQTSIETALRKRLIDTYADGTFKPDAAITRADFARLLVADGEVRQALGSAPKFSDVTGDLARIAEAVTSKGSSLKDYDFAANGMMSFTGTSFNPSGSVSRLDVAVALVKALGHDAEARALANTNVTSGGSTITDNAQIPASLRGYVQIALNLGLFEAFPAEIRQIGPGQFVAVPGPRFEPSTTVTRADLANRLLKYRSLFTTGG
jgi:serine protease AprX